MRRWKEEQSWAYIAFEQNVWLELGILWCYAARRRKQRRCGQQLILFYLLIADEECGFRRGAAGENKALTDVLELHYLLILTKGTGRPENELKPEIKLTDFVPWNERSKPKRIETPTFSCAKTNQGSRL
ncbi:hypothetical protein B0H19DRAFT_1055152 [Mycena capillaripes]|nr:hypothetical protein B0H19DRAFT_1055152 [Mycena capillaripes]